MKPTFEDLHSDVMPLINDVWRVNQIRNFDQRNLVSVENKVEKWANSVRPVITRPDIIRLASLIDIRLGEKTAKYFLEIFQRGPLSNGDLVPDYANLKEEFQRLKG